MPVFANHLGSCDVRDDVLLLQRNFHIILGMTGHGNLIAGNLDVAFAMGCPLALTLCEVGF